jgi:hypothetical protein
MKVVSKEAERQAKEDEEYSIKNRQRLRSIQTRQVEIAVKGDNNSGCFVVIRFTGSNVRVQKAAFYWCQ